MTFHSFHFQTVIKYILDLFILSFMSLDLLFHVPFHHFQFH